MYFLILSNSLSGTHGTIGRGSKERRFLKNDQSGNSTLQRKALDGREKDPNNIFEPNRKVSPTTHIPSFRINRDADTLTDEGYNTINTTIRFDMVYNDILQLDILSVWINDSFK